MTIQRQERLRYRGHEYALLDRPLDACTNVWTARRMERLHMTSTAMGRGYLGTWAIRQSRLYLVGLSAGVREHSSPTEWLPGQRDLEWLFPGCGGAVFAEWFTGRLRAGIGVPAQANHRQEWPRHRMFVVAAGSVTESRVVDNRAAYADCKRAGDTLRSYLDSLNEA